MRSSSRSPRCSQRLRLGHGAWLSDRRRGRRTVGPRPDPRARGGPSARPSSASCSCCSILASSSSSSVCACSAFGSTRSPCTQLLVTAAGDRRHGRPAVSGWRSSRRSSSAARSRCRRPRWCCRCWPISGGRSPSSGASRSRSFWSRTSRSGRSWSWSTRSAGRRRARARALAIALAKGVLVVLSWSSSRATCCRRCSSFIAAFAAEEVFTATAVLIVLGASFATEQAGLSTALGAFVAGLMVADTEYRHQIAADIAPFRGLLLGLFFMTVGMAIDLQVRARAHRTECSPRRGPAAAQGRLLCLDSRGHSASAARLAFELGCPARAGQRVRLRSARPRRADRPADRSHGVPDR